MKGFVAAAMFAVSLSSFADVEKIATMGQGGIALHWWPKVVVPDGWHHERGPSLQNGFNVLVPNGFDFSNAESVIYASALYKPREPKLKTLQALIDKDRRDFLGKDPTLAAKDADPIKSADGKAMRSVTFLPKGKGNWEQITYGEETEFYL